MNRAQQETGKAISRAERSIDRLADHIKFGSQDWQNVLRKARAKFGQESESVRFLNF